MDSSVLLILDGILCAYHDVYYSSNSRLEMKWQSSVHQIRHILKAGTQEW